MTPSKHITCNVKHTTGIVLWRIMSTRCCKPFYLKWNSVLFEKDNYDYLQHFLKRILTAGKDSRESICIFYFQKLKKRKFLKTDLCSRKNILRVCSMLVKTNQLKAIETLILNVNIGGNIHAQFVGKNVESVFDSMGLSLLWVITWILLFSKRATIVEENISWCGK